MTTLATVDRTDLSVDEIYSDLKARIGDYTPDFELQVKAELAWEINQLKRERNAVILGHNYMEPALFHSVPDFVGCDVGHAAVVVQEHDVPGVLHGAVVSRLAFS